MDRKRLIDMLNDQQGWVDAQSLAGVLRVSTRTVRAWVKRINEESGGTVIESSRLGYRLVQDASDRCQPEFAMSVNGADGAGRILRSLLKSSEGLSIYDLADELRLSDSYVANMLRDARSQASLFGLELIRRRDVLELRGTERQKRKLINHLIVQEGQGGFTSFIGLGMDPTTEHRAELIRSVSDALNDAGLTCNEYELNAIVLHLTTMIGRIRSGEAIEEAEGQDGEASPYVRPASDNRVEAAAHAVYDICRQCYRIPSFDSERRYLALSISLHTRPMCGQEVAVEEGPLVGPRELALAQDMVEKLEQTYHLDSFDAPFITRLAAHLHYLLLRAKEGSLSHNPLAQKTKATYPLFYDMAAFLAGAIEEGTGFSLDDDEIAFLAFHIGGFFESSLVFSSKVTCAFLHTDYLDMHIKSLNRIAERFSDRLTITEVTQISKVDAGSLRCDLVLTPMPLAVPNAEYVLVINPILTDRDLENIGCAIDRLLREKRRDRTIGLLQRLLRPDLFKRNFYAETKEELIERLTREAIERGLCGEAFLESVLKRERISSTAFDDQVAVPHPLTPLARRSFLSIVINDHPMDWDGQDVYLIMLIGMSSDDQKQIWRLFEDLLGVLANPRNVAQLLKSNSYSDFMGNLASLITNRHETGTSFQ